MNWENRLSTAVNDLAPSGIRKFFDIAAEMEDVISLGVGEPDFITPWAIRESCVYGLEQGFTAYTANRGLLELRQEIAALYKRNFNTTYDPAEEILVTVGVSEGLDLAMRAIVSQGDEVLIPEPCYVSYKACVTLAGGVPIPVAAKIDNDFRITAAELEAQITPRTKAVLLTNPGNPTGVVYTQEEMDMISAIVRKYDLALIADEVYREFVYDGAYRSFGTMPELADNLIIIDSVSKRYSACGARIGCIISKNKELAKQIIKCCQGRLCSPILEQVGAAALYTTPVSYLEEVNQEYKKRRDTIVAALKELPGVVASDPKGAFYIMVQLPVDDAEKFAIWTLENFAIDNETVMFAPGNGFYSDPELGVNEARLAYVLNCDDLKKAIYILGEALKAYPGKTN